MLTEQQLGVLRAACNRIIPADDYPAGWEAGVGDYLLRQFEGDLQPAVESYQQGLAALEAEAQAIHAQSFAALHPSTQDKLLTQVEQDVVATEWSLDPARFFKMLVDHCMEGFYSDPGNGGNRDEIAWKMIGFEVRG
jgi:hypothetical protein